MTVPTPSNSQPSPVMNAAGLGKVWPNPGMEVARRFSTERMRAWRDITGVLGPSKGPHPTPNSA